MPTHFQLRSNFLELGCHALALSLTPDGEAARSGSVKARHDYHPFGEEIVIGEGRNTNPDYVADGVRQRFTGKERDIESGLDYFNARYYSNAQGRFTSIDPENYQAMLDLSEPQSWNAYAYVNNGPLVSVDPDGKGILTKLWNRLRWGVFGEEEDVAREEQTRCVMLLSVQKDNGGELIIENLGGDLIRVDPANMTRSHVFFWSNRLMDIWEQGGRSRPLRPDEIILEGASAISSTPSAGGVKGPSGRESTEKYLKNNWDEATFANKKTP